MKKCILCNKEFTKSLDDVLARPNNFTFIVDPEDHYCDSCDARKRASSCVHMIDLSMTKAWGVVNNTSLKDPDAYLKKQFQGYRAFWIDWYTDFLKVLKPEDQVKYSYWLNVFNDYIEKHAQIRQETTIETRQKGGSL